MPSTGANASSNIRVVFTVNGRPVPVEARVPDRAVRFDELSEGALVPADGLLEPPPHSLAAVATPLFPFRKPRRASHRRRTRMSGRSSP